MTLADSISDDYQAWDGQETVVLRRSNGATHTVAGVLSRTVQVDEQSAGAALQLATTRRMFQVPAAALAGIVPRLGDELIDTTGRHWQVIAAEQATLGTRWRLSCLENLA